MERLEGLQTVRGLAANLVVVFHCLAIGLLPKYGFESRFRSWYFLEDFWSGVDVFFCISGFIMFYSYSNLKTNGIEFLLLRLIRIVPVYWLLTLTVCTLTFFVNGNFEFELLIRSLFFAVNLNEQYPILAVGWTLQYEILFYLVFGLGLVLFKQHLFYFVTFVLICLIGINPQMNIIAEFILGGIGFLVFKSSRFRNHSQSILVLSITLIIINMALFDGRTAENYRVVLFGIPSFLTVISIINLKLPKYSLQWAGQFSYSLYLIHFPLLSMYFKVLSKFTLFTLPVWFIILLAICLCNLAAFIFYKHIESPLTRFLRIKLKFYRK